MSEILDISSDSLEEMSGENVNEIMKENYFISEISYEEIIRKLTEQFTDYINNDNETNYVAYFFNCLYISYANLEDDEEEFPAEAKEALIALQTDFIDKLTELLSTRIGIEIPDIEKFDDDKLVVSLSNIYEYFVLNARVNFKVAISEYLNGNIKTSGNEYFRDLQSIIENNFLTYITLIRPESFLQITGGGKEIYSYFMNNTFTGNFLRKYSPALFKNENYKAEIINYTTMTKMLLDAESGIN